MLHSVIDDLRFKILFGILVAVPATLVVLLLGVYAIVLTGALRRDFEPGAALLVASFHCGVPGVAGAWLRLLYRKPAITSGLRTWIRGMLASGLLAAMLLIGMTISGEVYALSALLIVVLVIGVGFYVAT